ncbi:hypothetical protein DdX_07312 [Ditylenchus destructor]|uniref:Uncharacterized protein n=1 Tax=Ditylenchus destructor TaxID=166010 RepID=A0AAD4N8E9_9BILA|nr:hypothetical protein DdX_07312 [Ditylenchus destructor]
MEKVETFSLKIMVDYCCSKTLQTNKSPITKAKGAIKLKACVTLYKSENQEKNKTFNVRKLGNFDDGKITGRWRPLRTNSLLRQLCNPNCRISLGKEDKGAALRVDLA